MIHSGSTLLTAESRREIFSAFSEGENAEKGSRLKNILFINIDAICLYFRAFSALADGVFLISVLSTEIKKYQTLRSLRLERSGWQIFTRQPA